MDNASSHLKVHDQHFRARGGVTIRSKNDTKGQMLAAAFVPLFLLLVSVPTSALAQHPNFSGVWQLNPKASNFAGGQPPKSMALKITHQDPALIVVSRTVGPQGDQTGEYRWWTDGYVSKNTIRTIEYTNTVSWEGLTLVANSKAATQQGQVEMTDRWNLSGKVLTVSRNLTVAGKVVEQQYVYQKQ